MGQYPRVLEIEDYESGVVDQEVSRMCVAMAEPRAVNPRQGSRIGFYPSIVILVGQHLEERGSRQQLGCDHTAPSNPETPFLSVEEELWDRDARSRQMSECSTLMIGIARAQPLDR